jgi:glutathione S-transferase
MLARAPSSQRPLAKQQQQQQQQRQQGRLRRPRCRYAADPRGRDRFAETVVFTSADDDGALSPSSQAVLIALLEKRLPFRHVLVRHDADSASSGGESPAEFRELYAAANPAAGPRPASPPLLADCGTLVAGLAPSSSSSSSSSSDARVILEYLGERYRAVGAPLIPASPAAAATMRLFVDVFADAVAAPFRRFVSAPGGGKAGAAADAVSRARDEFFDGWRRVDAFLLAHARGAAAGFDALDAGAEMLYGQHRAFVVRPPQPPQPVGRRGGGGGPAARSDEDEDEVEDEGTLEGHLRPLDDDPAVDRGDDAPHEPSAAAAAAADAYLLGRGAYSLAEVSATPHVARMAALLPALRGIELVPELRARGLSRAAAWCEACLARPSAVATDPTADELVGGMAAAEWARV